MSCEPPVTEGLRREAHGEAGPVTVADEASPQGEYIDGREKVPLGGSYPYAARLHASERQNTADRTFFEKDMGHLP